MKKITFHRAGGLMGFVGSTCVYLAANVIVQQSYSGTNASAILGFVMAGSGIGGVIWSNLFPKLISELGWRFGYRVLGTCWAALALLALVILGKRDLTGGIGHAQTIGDGASKQEALRSPKFFLAAFIMCAITVCSCISQQLPAVLGGSALGTLMPVVVRQLFGGRDYAAIWSVVISCSSVASFLATPGWGMVYDTFGTYTPALVAMPILQALAVTALTMAFRKVK